MVKKRKASISSRVYFYQGRLRWEKFLVMLMVIQTVNLFLAVRMSGETSWEEAAFPATPSRRGPPERLRKFGFCTPLLGCGC